MRVNGSRCGRHARKYDYARNDCGKTVKVEVKSSQLVWETPRSRWAFRFQGIKWDCFDELRLAMYTPFAFFIYMHDAVTAVSTTGQSMHHAGAQIQLYGPSQQSDIRMALNHILEKPFGARLAFLEFDDPLVVRMMEEQNPTSRAYKGIPLATVARSTRGRILQAVVRAHDKRARPWLQFLDAEETQCVNGSRRGVSRSEYDYRRIQGNSIVRVEVKSASMVWQRGRNRWLCFFAAIKFDLFD